MGDIQLITNEILEDAVERTLKDLGRKGRSFRKGLLSEEECFQSMFDTLYHGFLCPLAALGIKTGFSRNSYGAFSKEYEAYIRGDGPYEGDHVPWLFVYDGAGCYEASPEDRLQFFRLMKEYMIVPEYFEPLPEGILSPGRTFVHLWNGCTAYSIEFRCISDLGLTEDEDTKGKTYILDSELGLEAAVTIKEDRRGRWRQGLDFDEYITVTPEGRAALKAEFLAEGYIEGYTAKERQGDPDILIRTGPEGKVARLSYYSFPDDETAYSEYPLWQEYLLWEKEKSLRKRDILSVLFDRFK